ncbi:ClpXP adapter SpxH family protein [Larkinella terrae]|uniref:DsbA family protein n=1 Tax=Larkinella terrae TaxID=2025311 RepID=A0A7K0EJZ2_9BACT|nr:ClpXP adapter SpxH family protein [Larkinella terrae]MRS62104.1 DsbA family protein [Larkinella terrae]
MQNPLLCDIETGLCERPDSTLASPVQAVSPTKKPVKISYFTDPICSSCWGIEPQLRRLKLEYGHALEIEYRMGGLLPDWSYNSGGISKPSDVAQHWDEVSQHYDMPIDGDVWLEDPLHSSFPPSIAFKAAQLQSPEMAIRFLRKIREMVFLQKKNITRWEHLAEAAQFVGLAVDRLKADFEGEAQTQFRDDLKLGQELGVRGFPSLFFGTDAGNQEFVYGTKPYSVYENALKKVHPSIQKREIDHQWQPLFAHYPTLTAREFSELSGVSRPESEAYLQNLTEQGHLSRLGTKNGDLWIRKES